MPEPLCFSIKPCCKFFCKFIFCKLRIAKFSLVAGLYDVYGLYLDSCWHMRSPLFRTTVWGERPFGLTISVESQRPRLTTSVYPWPLCGPFLQPLWTMWTSFRPLHLKPPQHKLPSKGVRFEQQQKKFEQYQTGQKTWKHKMERWKERGCLPLFDAICCFNNQERDHFTQICWQDD